MDLNKLENLLLNIMGGLQRKDLTEDEVRMLENEYGKDWEKLVFGDN